jgi:hypothetical protein
MGIDWNTTLAEVMEKGIELEVVELMLKIIMEKHEKELDEIMEKNAVIRAIKNINAGRNKAIETLCEGYE